MKYLGLEPKRPRVAIFDFTGCEGCELQLVNKEDTLVGFLEAIEIVRFREASSAEDGAFDIAIVDGAVTRDDEVDRLQEIRIGAGLLVAVGSCACFGGVNRMKNDYDLDEANREVYGDTPKATSLTRRVKDVVPVDIEIPGCPVSKAEVERIVQHIIWEVPYHFPEYPVCLECKQRFTVCLFEKGQLCLGPIAKAGCNAPCPTGGLGCWGCRGPATDPNYEEFLSLASERGHDEEEIAERMMFFGGFEGVL
jgi:coenzyme F420-reducing hydrogenase gamma subunit